MYITRLMLSYAEWARGGIGIRASLRNWFLTD